MFRNHLNFVYKYLKWSQFWILGSGIYLHLIQIYGLNQFLFYIPWWSYSTVPTLDIEIKHSQVQFSVHISRSKSESFEIFQINKKITIVFLFFFGYHSLIIWQAQSGWLNLLLILLYFQDDWAWFNLLLILLYFQDDWAWLNLLLILLYFQDDWAWFNLLLILLYFQNDWAWLILLLIYT